MIKKYKIHLLLTPYGHLYLRSGVFCL